MARTGRRSRADLFSNQMKHINKQLAHPASTLREQSNPTKPAKPSSSNSVTGKGTERDPNKANARKKQRSKRNALKANQLKQINEVILNPEAGATATFPRTRRPEPARTQAQDVDATLMDIDPSPRPSDHHSNTQRDEYQPPHSEKKEHTSASRTKITPTHKAALAKIRGAIRRRDKEATNPGNNSEVTVINDIDIYVCNITNALLVKHEGNFIPLPSYLSIRGIPPDQKVRYEGLIPKWAKKVLDKEVDETADRKKDNSNGVRKEDEKKKVDAQTAKPVTQPTRRLVMQDFIPYGPGQIRLEKGMEVEVQRLAYGGWALGKKVSAEEDGGGGDAKLGWLPWDFTDKIRDS